MKVADVNGVILDGIVRNGNNGLVVTDKAAYQKYMAEKQRIEKLHSLEQEVTDIKSTLSQILEILKNRQQVNL